MDLSTVQAEVEIESEDDEDEQIGLSLLTSMVGKLHEVDVLTDDNPELIGQVLGLIVLLATQTAVDHDIDIDEYVTEQVEEMIEERETAEELRDAVENEDYAAVAKAMGLDDDDDNTRAFA